MNKFDALKQFQSPILSGKTPANMGRNGLKLIWIAMVDRAFIVLKVDPVKGWKKLSKRTRGRPKND